MEQFLYDLRWIYRNPATPIWLDWISSLIMATSVWAWVYNLVDSPLREGIHRAVMRWNEASVNLSPWSTLGRQLSFDAMMEADRKRLGNPPKIPVRLRFKYTGIAILQLFAPLWYLVSLLFHFIVRVTLKALRGASESLFVGRFGRRLFVIGFIVWNVAKVISLLTLPDVQPLTR